MSFAQRAADELTEYLSAVPGVETITPAGSLRRAKDTVGDLDLPVTGPGGRHARQVCRASQNSRSARAKDPTRPASNLVSEGLQVDLRALASESYGAALLYFTGSKEHNIVLRSRAQKMGLTLNEYGLARVNDETIVASETEEAIYAKLGLDWIPPELRENSGEIEAAAEHRLPHLVELADMRGDLHMHTTESDGRASFDEMVEAARERGLEYVAITDHSKALAMANGLDEGNARRLRPSSPRHGSARVGRTRLLRP